MIGELPWYYFYNVTHSFSNIKDILFITFPNFKISNFTAIRKLFLTIKKFGRDFE